MGKYYSLYNNAKLRKGGRKIAKLSEKQFGEKAKKFILDTCKDDSWTVDKISNTNATNKIISSLPHAIRTIYYNDKKGDTIIKKDFKGIEPDWENNDITGGLRTVKGCPYIIMTVGGDWECSLCVMVYYDGKQFRCYIPEKGNAYRKDTKRLFGNCDASYNSKTETYTDEWKKNGKTYISDDKYAFDELVKEGILDKEKDKDKLRGLGRNIEFDTKKCIEDFVSRVEPISVKESYHRISSNDIKLIYESVLDETNIEETDDAFSYAQLSNALFDLMYKLDTDKIPFINNIQLQYNIPYLNKDKYETLTLNKYLGWYAGLMMEDTIIKCIKKYLDNINIKLSNEEKSDIQQAENGQRIYDCIIKLNNQNYNGQIKVIQKKNISNSINSPIRDGNDLAIIICYIINNNCIYIDTIYVCIPKEEIIKDGKIVKTFSNYTKKKKLNGKLKKVLNINGKIAMIKISNNIDNIK